MNAGKSLDEKVLSYLDASDINALKQVSVHTKIQMDFKTEESFLKYFYNSVLNDDIEGIKRILSDSKYRVNPDQVLDLFEYATLTSNNDLLSLVWVYNNNNNKVTKLSFK